MVILNEVLTLIGFTQTACALTFALNDCCYVLTYPVVFGALRIYALWSGGSAELLVHMVSIRCGLITIKLGRLLVRLRPALLQEGHVTSLKGRHD